MSDLGIDYGMGKSNRDQKTGIHYGVISQNEVLQAWADSSEAYYPCDGCEQPDGEDHNCDFCEAACYIYNEDGYEAECGDDGDIFITKSPYYTECQYCSPCAPGAGYLMNPIPEGIKTYCFDSSWFESVETGKKINCTYCDGTGLRKKADIPNYTDEKFKGLDFDDNRVKCWVCIDGWKIGDIGKVKEMVNKAPYPVYSVATGEEVK